MQQRDWLGLLGLAALICSAMVFGGVAILAASQQLWPLVAAILLLGLAQIAAVVMGAVRIESLHEEIGELVRERRAVEQEYYVNFVQSEAFNNEIGALKQRAARIEQDAQRRTTQRDTQYRELDERIRTLTHPRETRLFGDLATGITPPPHVPPPPSSFDPQHITSLFTSDLARGPGKQPFSGLTQVFGKEGIAPDRRAARDHLNFLLEPIIDLAINETEHYRARFTMTTTSGTEIGFGRLVANADRSGLRASLDLHVVHQALPLIRRLRGRHPNMRLFVPIGAATLMNEATLRKIMDLVIEASDAGQGLVFEIEHSALGRLDEHGITGLALLARRGFSMALVDVDVAGLDLSSLRHLGVKYIGISANSVESGYGVSPTWQDFVQVARGLQFQILLLDVSISTQAASASQVARLASGPFFAPPRRVKGAALGEDSAAFRVAA